MLPIDIVFLISCIYVPCLILLYLAEIWTILKPGSPFKSSFYYLFVTGALVDLVFTTAATHVFRLVFFPLVNGFFDGYECLTCLQIRIKQVVFKEPAAQSIERALAYVLFICPFAQDMLNMFVALNRFTSIGMAMDNDRIWKKMLPISIITSILVPSVMFFPTFWRRASYTKIPIAPNWDFYFPQEDFSYLPWLNTHRIMSIEMIITSTIIVVLYALSARNLRKLTGDTATKRQERNLLIFGMVNFVLQIFAMFPQIMLDFNFLPIEWTIMVFYQFAWLTDIKTFCAAITMITVNTTFRKHMLIAFKIVRRTKPINIVSITAQREQIHEEASLPQLSIIVSTADKN